MVCFSSRATIHRRASAIPRGSPLRVRSVGSGLLKSFAGLIAVTLLVTACTTVGPDYVKPGADVADQWIDVDDPRVKADPVQYRDWWTVFNDPVLDFLVATAYKQNLTLRAAGVRILQARAVLGLSVANQYPEQEVRASYTRVTLSENTSPTGSPPGETDFNVYQLGFDASWELDFWGRFRRGVESSNADLGASIANYDDILVSLVAEVAATYVQIRTFEERLKFARANVKVQERSFRIADVRFRNGAVTELDVQEAKGSLRNTQALIPELERGLRQAQNALSVLLGMPPQDLRDILGGPMRIPTAPPDVAVGVPAELLRRRPDIRRAEREAAAQSAQIGVAVADLYPRLSILGTIGISSSDFAEFFTTGSVTGFGGPSVVWPVFNYGRFRNNIRVQDGLFQELVVDYQNTVLKAAQEVEDGLVGFLRNQEAVGFLTDAVKATKRSVDLSLIQYREGTVDFNRVLDAQTRLVEQQDRLAETTGDISLSLVATYKALGGGWESRVGQDFVPPETKEIMRARTNWGGLLTSPENVTPKPVRIIPAAP
ncbi:MAG: efflux transporter outer membrane subunit, partial [Nitrospiraceae bacterium]